VQLAPVLVMVLEWELEPVQEPVLERELGQVRELVLALVPGLERVLELHRQPGSRLITMPAGLTISSFSSIKTPSFRFWPAKITLLLKAITPPFSSYLVIQAKFAFN